MSSFSKTKNLGVSKSKSNHLRVLGFVAIVVALGFGSSYLSAIGFGTSYLYTTEVVGSTSSSYLRSLELHAPEIDDADGLEEFALSESQVHFSCPQVQSSEDYNATNVTDAARRFRTSAVDTWRLLRRNLVAAEGGISVMQHDIQNAYITYTLQLQLVECPQHYMASTFHIQSVAAGLIFAGSIGPRYKIEDGCGFYNATIPVVLPHSWKSNDWNKSNHEKEIINCVETETGPSITNASGLVSLEAFWTSHYSNHANQISDMKRSERIYANKDNLTSDQIAEILGVERLDYLARHLDVLPEFPVALELEEILETSLQGSSSGTHDAETYAGKLLPNCSSVPLADWLPVGVVSHSNTWLYQGPKCNYTTWTREDIRYWLAGLRVRYLGDSHCEFQNKNVFKIVCPESDLNKFFKDRYECPEAPNNTFSYGWRFYRGIVKTDTMGSTDGLSHLVRNVSPDACAKVLGVGTFNVTIITTPTWLFVYETQEGLDTYLRSLKDLIGLCHSLYPSEMNNLVLLLQSPTAADVFPHDRAAADGWRQNHNFREERYTKIMYDSLGPLVDGILPVFEWTLARNWKLRTSDGVHLRGEFYEEVFHMQVSAIISAMKFGKGWDVPLMAQDDNETRWFVGVEMS